MASSNGHHAGGAAKGEELSKMEQRRCEVASLMTAQFTYREMAERFGVAPSTISEDVKVIRERWRERAVADYASHLAEEFAKLDLLEREVLPMALSGGPKGGVNLRAVDRALAIVDRRIRMLGPGAPSKVEAAFKVERIVRAFEDTLAELGIDDRQVRPVLGRRLRELDAPHNDRPDHGDRKPARRAPRAVQRPRALTVIGAGTPGGLPRSPRMELSTGI
jgi:Bacterial purine repressor, N-terminal